MATATGQEVYRPKDALGMAFQATLVMGGAGLMFSGIQNTLAKENIGAMGIFTRSGGTFAVFAAVGGSYEFVRRASANLREKEDSWNPTLGGFCAGAIIGLRFGTMPAVLGYGAGAAVLMGVYDYTGGALTGYTKDPEVDEFERKQNLRKNRRRPIQETIEELGEGRGIYGPGYQERRRQRLKEKYGIDVPADA